MLRHRLFTAAVLIPLFVWGTLSLPSQYFAALIGAVVALGAWEWSTMIGWRANRCYAYVGVGIALMALADFYLVESKALYALLLVVVIWWAFNLAWIVRYNRKPEIFHDGTSAAGKVSMSARWVKALVGLGALVPAWTALVALHESHVYGPKFVVFLLALIWLADTGAYVAGRLWGKAKLAPNVSPGKTWMGLAGAFAVALPASAAGGGVLGFGWDASLVFALIGLITVAFSVVGDLLESMFKRQAGVKDSGTLLPGHGGVLDRIDSLTAAAPVFLFSLLAAGIAS